MVAPPLPAHLRRTLGVISVALTLGAADARAETVYVIDQITLGLHAEGDVTSPVVEMVASGVALEVLERDGAMLRVRTPHGASGWIDANYTAATPPASARLTGARGTIEALRVELDTLRRETERLKTDLIDSEETRKRQIEAISRDFESQLEDARAGPAAPHAAGSPAAGGQPGGEAGGAARAARDDADGGRIPSDTLRELQRLAEENRSLKGTLTERERALAERPAPAASTAPTARPAGAWRTWTEASSHTRWLLASLALLAFALGAAWHDYLVRRRHGGFRL